MRHGLKYLFCLGDKRAYKIAKAIEEGFCKRNSISCTQLYNLQIYEKRFGTVWLKRINNKTKEFIDLHPCLMKVRVYSLKNPFWRAIQKSINEIGIKYMIGKDDYLLNEKNLFLK